MTVQQKLPFTGGLGLALRKTHISKGGEEKELGHRSPQPREPPGLFPSESRAGKVSKAAFSKLRNSLAVKKVPKSLFILPLFGGDLAV